MSQSKSKLLNYISLLLSDDEALQRFLIDPITDAEGKYGLTKAERAVLRRTVFHLSNRSLNGYTLVRHLGSYRRSLRLLQNVLHNVGSKMAQEAHVAATAPALIPTDPPMATYTVVIYVPSVATQPGFSGSFTGKYNADVGNAYATSVPYTVSYPYAPTTSPTTIQDVMNAIPGFTFVSVTGSGGFAYVNSITPSSEYPAIVADPTGYQSTDDYVFWFWSINGAPNFQPGFGGSQSFAQQVLQPNDTVYWQVIAPDSAYGFVPCEPTQGNAFAEAAKAAKASKT